MPLNHGADQLIRTNLEQIQQGKKVRAIVIGFLTAEQLLALNTERARRDFPGMAAEIVFLGRHIFESRVLRDGYTITDVLMQITTSMDAASAFHATPKMNALVSAVLREDGYGNRVTDMAVFECTSRYPRPELYSVIPKGDEIKPVKKK